MPKALRVQNGVLNALRVALGVQWITGRMGDPDADEGRRQTRLGAFFDRRAWLLRTLAIVALAWGAAYLTWRIGWSGEGTSPVAFWMLLVTEIYGLTALAVLAWFSWSRPPAERPAITQRHSVDIYVCTYDEPVEVVFATLAGCRALSYPHTTYLLDDGRRPEMEELAQLSGARYLTRPDNSHAKAGNINAALPRTDGELVFVLDADHVPMPDALDALVGYFDDERMAHLRCYQAAWRARRGSAPGPIAHREHTLPPAQHCRPERTKEIATS